MRILAQLKRVFECTDGDPDIREVVSGKAVTDKAVERFKQIGVSLDMKDIAFIWEIPYECTLYITALLLKDKITLPDGVAEKAENYPLLKLWRRYVEVAMQSVCSCQPSENIVTTNSALNNWRKRRIAAAKSELGHFGNVISHPLYAFELSSGCGVGCWFCSFATDKLKDVLDYETNKDYFAAVIGRCVELFGKQGAGSALPYYRTEPHDNPHYIDYLKDFEEITGSVLCTSTAVGNDKDWVKALLAYYGDKSPWPRLSVLSVGMLKTIYENFTPEELIHRQLLMQMKENLRPKVSGGRILEEKSGIRDISPDADIKQTIVPQGSIACASGFLINLVRRTIDVFSPCYTSAKWPYGYRVFDSAVYEDENDFPIVIQKLINKNMHMSPPMDKPLRFRDDMVYKKTDAGFDLVTPNQIHHFRLKDKCGPVGELINSGNMTNAEIQRKLIDEHGINPFVVGASIQKLFDDGMIDEVYS
ncbi:MAG: radical SAM family RiPP maturation amino acid epimerase [Deferribacterales bacterium]